MSDDWKLVVALCRYNAKLMYYLIDQTQFECVVRTGKSGKSSKEIILLL